MISALASVIHTLIGRSTLIFIHILLHLFALCAGTNIGMRHRLQIVIDKRWYQFQTVMSQPVYIYKHQQAVSSSLSTWMQIPVREEVKLL